MSELVEDNYDLIFNQVVSSEPNLSDSDTSILDGLVQHFSRTHGDNFNIKIGEFNKLRKNLTLFTHMKFSPWIFDILLRIRIDLRNKKTEFQIHFLQQQNNFSKVASPVRKCVCRKILKINQQLWKKGFKMVQSLQNGSFSLLGIVQNSQYAYSSKKCLWNAIRNGIKEAIEFVEDYRMKFSQIISPQKYRSLCLKNGEYTKKMHKDQVTFGKLIRQVSMSHIRFSFTDKEEFDSQIALSKSNVQQQNLRKLISQIKNEKFLRDSNKFYSCEARNLLDISEQQLNYQIDGNEQAQYNSYLKMPLPKDPSPGQNKFIFNHIEILKPQHVRFHATSKQGGKNRIHVSKLSFYYCASSLTPDRQSLVPFYRDCTFINDKGNSQLINPVLTKLLAVKVPKHRGPQKSDDKSENEAKIISLFKSQVSAYVLKYYKSQQAKFEFRKYFLMDYLPNAQPLSNFIQMFKQTISLNSKIYLIVNMCNGLRFIDKCEVVHMDLNLNNVLVYKDYLTKLIDFGEAYSGKIKLSNAKGFKRGYTFPFSSPQYFERKDMFTIKQDVFSLGMIIYRMVFDQYPFFPSVKAVQSYKDKSYGQKILLAPQRGQDYGNGQTMDLLYRIIFKCIQPDELARCEPSWLTIFLKSIYFHLI